MDKLYAEGITSSNGVASMEFSFPNPTQDSYMETVDQHSSSMKSALSLPLQVTSFIRALASSLPSTHPFSNVGTN